MRHFLRKVFMAAMALPMVCCGQGTLQVSFEGPPAQPRGTAALVQNYSESGIWFRSIGSIGFVRLGGGYPQIPDNATKYLQAGLGSDLAWSYLNGPFFAVVSMDLAAYSTLAPDFIVTFIGYRSAGSTINTSFSGTGINFRTVYFGPDWSYGLTRVEIPNYGWSLDNLVLSIPEPAAGTISLVEPSSSHIAE